MKDSERSRLPVEPFGAEPIDLCVIGGGIQGAGVARDAAGRGLSVVLCERDDLAAATSSASSKLIHGGLRYLEQGALRLVREGLAEREILLAAAPHLVRPLRFLLPHTPGLRPVWMLRLGLFAYDRLARRGRLPASRALHLASHPAGRILAPDLQRGFLYSDCLVDDARLVLANARDAARRGAEIRTRTEVTTARRVGPLWEIDCLATDLDGARRASRLRARALVNAAGPWVRRVLDDVVPARTTSSIRKVKGSHIVVPALGLGDLALILQAPDRRVVFVIPWFGRSLVGTTDVPLDGDPGEAVVSPEEVRYLCDSVSRFLRVPIGPGDVLHAFTGVRPLFDDGRAEVSENTRDDQVEREGDPGEAPLVSIFGGKLTTYRRVAERVIEALSDTFSRPGENWTANAPLPGGALPRGDPAAFLTALCAERPALPAEMLEALVARHGSEARAVLGDARRPADLGARLLGDVTEREVEWFVREEWAREPEDVLLRRTKAVLEDDAPGRAALADCVTRLAREAALRRPPEGGPGRR